MYKLNSSDVNNSRFLEAIETNYSLRDRYKNFDFNSLAEIIFHDEITKEVYDNIVFALSL